jgi:hypothetical protein
MAIHIPAITEITEQGWRNAGYRWLVICPCGFRRECIAIETAENTLADHRRQQ